MLKVSITLFWDRGKISFARDRPYFCSRPSSGNRHTCFADYFWAIHFLARSISEFLKIRNSQVNMWPKNRANALIIS